ncbi:hypothetical protein B484DRAFT_391768, partial [Ochromonadaceae sp. CCMP2298]
MATYTSASSSALASLALPLAPSLFALTLYLTGYYQALGKPKTYAGNRRMQRLMAK